MDQFSALNGPDKILELTPKDDRQHLLQAQAASVVLSLGETRWLLILELYSPYSGPIQVSSAPLGGALTQLGD